MAHVSRKEVNEICDDMDLEHTYRDHCCDPVIVHPFVIINGEKVYSEPSDFHVAANNMKGVGYQPDADWQIRMEAAHINPKIILRVQLYLTRHKPCDCEDI